MTRILRIILILVLFITVLIMCSSCSTTSKYGCGPSKGSRDYAKVISVKRTISGDYKYVVYTDLGFEAIRDRKYIPKDSCALICRR